MFKNLHTQIYKYKPTSLLRKTQTFSSISSIFSSYKLYKYKMFTNLHTKKYKYIQYVNEVNIKKHKHKYKHGGPI